MITEIWAKNYRSLKDVQVTLAPITILVGHNGSGKSNLIDVARFLCESLQSGLNTAVINRQNMSTIRRWSSKGRPFDVEIGIKVEDKDIEAEIDWEATYSFTLGSTKKGEYRIKKEVCIINNKIDNSSHSYSATDKGYVKKPEQVTPPIQERNLILPFLSAQPPYNRLYEYLTNFSFYNIFPNSLIEPQKSANPYPLGEYGSNLASTLYDIQRSNGKALSDLKDAIKAIVPGVTGFKVRTVGGYLITTLRHDMNETQRAEFNLFQQSDGTLRIIGVLTALHQHPPRTLLGIEEPELAIHPGALQMLWEELEDASERSQIIMTTHSPDLLDMCKADQLRVVEKIDGITHIDEIEEAQKKIIKDRLFAPGELLRANGLRRQTKQLELLN